MESICMCVTPCVAAELVPVGVPEGGRRVVGGTGVQTQRWVCRHAWTGVIVLSYAHRVHACA